MTSWVEIERWWKRWKYLIEKNEIIVKKHIILWTISCATTIINNDVKFSLLSIIIRETRLKAITSRNESEKRKNKLFLSFLKLSCESNENRYRSVILQLLIKKIKIKNVNKEIKSKFEKNILKVKLSNSKFAIQKINYDIICKRFENKWKTLTIMHVNNVVCKWMLKNNIIWKKRNEHKNLNSRDANLSFNIKEIEKMKK